MHLRVWSGGSDGLHEEGRGSDAQFHPDGVFVSAVLERRGRRPCIRRCEVTCCPRVVSGSGRG